MSEISVRALGEEDWQQYRDIRLAALQEAPDAFVATWAQEEAFDEQVWRARMLRSTRLLAEREGSVVGVVSLGQAEESFAHSAELFGFWVAPEARGTGVAWKLVEAGAEEARKEGHSQLGYWVGTDNGRAVAFASSFGFRPGNTRRPMLVAGEDGAEDRVRQRDAGAANGLDGGVLPG